MSSSSKKYEADVVDNYTYDVFGAVRSQSGSSENYWLFTGEQDDADSEMYYLRARFPSPSCHRFRVLRFIPDNQ